MQVQSATQWPKLHCAISIVMESSASATGMPILSTTTINGQGKWVIELCSRFVRISRDTRVTVDNHGAEAEAFHHLFLWALQLSTCCWGNCPSDCTVHKTGSAKQSANIAHIVTRLCKYPLTWYSSALFARILGSLSLPFFVNVGASMLCLWCSIYLSTEI